MSAFQSQAVTLFQAMGEKGHVGYFLKREDADRAGEGKDEWGGNGYVSVVYAIRHDGFYYLLRDESPVTVANNIDEHLVNSAMSKLSKSEIEAFKKAIGGK